VLSNSLSAEVSALAERLSRILISVHSGSGGGSGTAWTANGLVVTNSHVVPGEAATAVLADGSEHEARMVARDAEKDLALLRVGAALEPAEAGDSSTLQPGHLVFAIGNPWGQRGTLTSGIVLSRGGATAENETPIRDVVRADLQLAPGNSGGPMVNARGQVVGINSMIVGGMAVAIPVNTVIAFVAEASRGEAGFLGVTLQPVELPHAIAASYSIADDTALMLTGIEPGSPAEEAGLLPGDVVLGISGGPRGLRHLGPALKRMRAGVRVDLALLRAGAVVSIPATPIARN
jgi:serine protease Do